jgi:hypothetical protein
MIGLDRSREGPNGVSFDESLIAGRPLASALVPGT